MTFHVCKVMTQMTGQRGHPYTRSPQSVNRNITDSILNRGYKYRVQSHVRIQEFLPGASRPDCQKAALHFSPQLCT